jgi:hypothetical protein
MLSRESDMYIANTLEAALDKTKNPVFIHYLIALDGGILGSIETARSKEFRNAIFPEKDIISRTSRGSHFEWEVTDTKREVTLKKKQENGFFIALRGTKGTYPGMEGEGSLLTL